MWGWLQRWTRPGNARVGQQGEKQAARFLRQQGYRILARNLRCRWGEIDLLALAPDQRTIVIVEVKAGTGLHIAPQLRVSHAKQRKLSALAAQLARRHHLERHPFRFDVISVIQPPGSRPRIQHFVAAFQSTL